MVLKSTARPLPGRAARHWLTVLIGTVSGCLALGCQSGPRVQKYVEMVNAERRTLEDRVYALEYDLDLVEAELADARAENDRLSRELYGDKGAPARSGGSRPARPTRSSSGAGSGRSSASPVPRDELIPPEIDAGEPTELGPPRTTPPMAPPELPAGPGGPSGRAVPAAPTIPDDSSSPGSPVPPEAPRAPSVSVPPERSAPTGIPLPPGTAPAAELLELPDRQTEGEEPVGLTGPGNARPAAAVPVTPGSAYLALDATITGGADFDGEPGDDGITLGLVLRDERGRPMAAVGALSAVLLDPRQRGDAARVARWDLEEAQVARLLRGQNVEAYTLHLAWPGDPPRSERLRLFVRYQLPGGEVLEAQREIAVQIAGQSATRRAVSMTTRPIDPDAPTARPRHAVVPASAEVSQDSLTPRTIQRIPIDSAPAEEPAPMSGAGNGWRAKKTGS
ncbi:MAG: hypothetical protein ACKPEY_17985 [Planctomycetota bacterium]